MLKLKDAGKMPQTTHGNDKHAKNSGTPPHAIGRDGGAKGRQTTDKIGRTKVAKSALVQGMP
jgi:hypothetical protein